MSCPTTITPAPIPGIGDTRVVTLHGLADAQTVIREHAEMARELSALQTDIIWQTADEMRDRAAWAVQSAIKLLTDRDEVLADAVQSARLQADMIEQLKAQLARAHDALEEIALAGMSGSGQESPEGLMSWHAGRAFEFIGIAARARWPAPAPAAAPERAEPVVATFGAYTPDNDREVVIPLQPAAAPAPAQPCRTCGPDGCPDSCSCPKGGAA